MSLKYVAVLVAALSLPTAALAATPAAVRHPVPPIHEAFTVLPCSGSPAHRTTVEMEGCAEHLVVSRDSKIDGLANTLAAKLSTGGQRDLVSGARAWLTYRNADCRALASEYAGGTEAGVAEAQCLATGDAARIAELRTLIKDASPSR